jgi:hypothetical protein
VSTNAAGKHAADPGVLAGTCPARGCSEAVEEKEESRQAEKVAGRHAGNHKPGNELKLI